MRRLIERLLVIGLTLGGLAYSQRLDLANVHGVDISGSPLGFIQAAVAIAVILFAVIPAFLSVFDGRRMPAMLVIGELVGALLLFGASERVLHESVHANIVGTGDARVLAVRASATMEVVE